MSSSRRYRQVALIVAVVTVFALLAGWGYLSTRTRSAASASPAGQQSTAVQAATASRVASAAEGAAQAAAQAAAMKAAADKAAADKAAADKAAADKAAADKAAADKAVAAQATAAQAHTDRTTRQPSQAPQPPQPPVVRHTPPPPAPPAAGPVSQWVTAVHPSCTGTRGNYTLTLTIRWSNGHEVGPVSLTGDAPGLTTLSYNYAGQSDWLVHEAAWNCPQ